MVETVYLPAPRRKVSRLPVLPVSASGWQYSPPDSLLEADTVDASAELVAELSVEPLFSGAAIKFAVRLPKQRVAGMHWDCPIWFKPETPVEPETLADNTAQPIRQRRASRLPKQFLAHKQAWSSMAVSALLSPTLSRLLAPADSNTVTIECDVNIKRIVEAILFAANKPLSVKQIQEIFPEWEQPKSADILAALESIAEDYWDRPIGLKQLASGYRFQVKEGMAQWVTRLFEEKPARYSRALLETVAIIAYRQPVTRGEIEDIRGVSVSTSIIQTLLEREWVRVIAHKEVPGRPALYGTTKQFLDYFNLTSISELPTLMEIAEFDFGIATQPQPEQETSERPQTEFVETEPAETEQNQLSAGEAASATAYEIPAESADQQTYN